MGGWTLKKGHPVQEHVRHSLSLSPNSCYCAITVLYSASISTPSSVPSEKKYEKKGGGVKLNLNLNLEKGIVQYMETPPAKQPPLCAHTPLPLPYLRKRTRTNSCACAYLYICYFQLDPTGKTAPQRPLIKKKTRHGQRR